MQIYHRHAVFLILVGLFNKSSSSSSSSWRSPGPVSQPEQEWRRLPGRCTIDILNESEWSHRFLSEYWLRRPVMLRGFHSPEIESLKRRLERDAMVSEFGDIEILTGTNFDLSLEGSGQKLVKLRDYVKSMQSKEMSSGYSFDRGEFFEKTGLSKEWKTIPGFSSTLTYGKDPAAKHATVVLALGITGQGIPFHWHRDSYSVALHGRKRWAIYAPGKMTPTGFLATESFVTWLQKRRQGSRFLAPEYECIQEPGDIVYVPEGFYHATACIGDSVAVTHISETLAWPTNKTAYSYYAAGMEKKGLKSAMKLLKKGAKHDPSNAVFPAARGSRYSDIGDWESVEREAKAAIKLNPFSMQGFLLLESALKALGKKEELEATLRLAQDLGVLQALRSVDEL